MSSIAPSPIDTSALCLPCGLCCNGVLHTHVVIQPDEIEQVGGLGLTVEMFGSRPGFRQPCLHFKGMRCGVYERRPSACREYECGLLQKTLAGDISFEDSLAIVQRARSLYDKVLAALPPGYTWEQLAEELDDLAGEDGEAQALRRYPRLVAAVEKLRRFTGQYFRR
jgi:Fe-S-cluster containining protein